MGFRCLCFRVSACKHDDLWVSTTTRWVFLFLSLIVTLLRIHSNGWHQGNFSAALDLHHHALNHSSSHLCATIKQGRNCWNLPQLTKHWRSISSCYLRYGNDTSGLFQVSFACGLGLFCLYIRSLWCMPQAASKPPLSIICRPAVRDRGMMW